MDTVIAKFKPDQNPAGVGCLMQSDEAQYVILAPDIVALRAVMSRLKPGFVVDESKCKPAKLMPLSA